MTIPLNSSDLLAELLRVCDRYRKAQDCRWSSALDCLGAVAALETLLQCDINRGINAIPRTEAK